MARSGSEFKTEKLNSKIIKRTFVSSPSSGSLSPSIYSITSTRRVDSRGNARGMATRLLSTSDAGARLSASRHDLIVVISCEKSSSGSIFRTNSLNALNIDFLAGKSTPVAQNRRVTMAASARINCSTPWCCSLTATREPSGSVARCTCAMDADATALKSNDAKTDFILSILSSDRSVSRTCASSSALSWSCSLRSCRTNGGGRISARPLTAWPSFVYIPPTIKVV